MNKYSKLFKITTKSFLQKVFLEKLSQNWNVKVEGTFLEIFVFNPTFLLKCVFKKAFSKIKKETFLQMIHRFFSSKAFLSFPNKKCIKALIFFKCFDKNFSQTKSFLVKTKNKRFYKVFYNFLKLNIQSSSYKKAFHTWILPHRETLLSFF